MKSLFVVAALLLPAAAFANSHMEKKDAAMATDAAMAPAGLPKCSAKVQDSCDQSMTTEKNALTYYPAETRDAGNNKIGMAKTRRMTKTTTVSEPQ